MAFFVGATFSWLVGFVGMSLAVRGNLRVAAAARTSYGGAILTYQNHYSPPLNKCFFLEISTSFDKGARLVVQTFSGP